MSTFGSRRTRRRQQGAAALAVALVLLFAMTLIGFFANRGMIFEQRSSANQYRSTRAFEMAEAGLEWAVARLNDNAEIATTGACTPDSSSGVSFADRYLPVSAAGFSVTALQPGCSIAGGSGAATCGCPTAGNATLGSSSDPRFLVQFNTWAGDPWMVEVVSYGCTNGSTCGPTGTDGDAIAVVRALYKMKPALPHSPGAGLITGTYVNSGGSITVTNLDMASNGITINSGTTVEIGSATKVNTLAGTPPRASVLDNDPSLSELTNVDVNGETFFTTFFGETFAEYKNNPKTWLIASNCSGNTRCSTCNTDSSCAAAVSAKINDGEYRFWSDQNLDWVTSNLPSSGTLGEPDKPIMVAGSANLKIGSQVVGYGMFYSATATVETEIDLSGGGGAKIFGAIVSRGGFEKQGGGDFNLIYDPNIFKPENLRGLMVRVPGSWRDKSAEY